MAKEMKRLLIEIHQAVENASGQLTAKASQQYQLIYQSILEAADKECPTPDEKKRASSRGRLKRS